MLLVVARITRVSGFVEGKRLQKTVVHPPRDGTQTGTVDKKAPLAGTQRVETKLAM